MSEALSSWLPRVAGFGPFFAAESHGEGAPPAPWRTFEQLIEDPTAHVELVRGKLAAANFRAVDEIEPRVAASVAHLGLAARLLSPAFGVALLSGGFPRLENSWWQPEHGGAFPLSLAEGELAAFPTTAVSRLNEAFARLHVASAILDGNIASALHGAAATVIRSGLSAAALPTAGGREACVSQSGTSTGAAARHLLAALLGDPALAQGARFRRRSCCLIYRAAPSGRGGLCGDCVLDRLPAPAR